jgi:hypothetical protein
VESAPVSGTQYLERGGEGKLLREAGEKGEANVAKRYHHETVRIDGGSRGGWLKVAAEGDRGVNRLFLCCNQPIFLPGEQSTVAYFSLLA